MKKAISCFKWVSKDLTTQNTFKWKIGKWREQSGTLKLCSNGLHGCLSPLDSLDYATDRMFLAEARGEILKDDDKFCSSKMRIVKEIPETVLRWFAISCARRALKYWDAKYPNDHRPEEAIEAAEAYYKNPTQENLKKMRVAGSAALSAAVSAAGSAAWSAVSAAESAAWSAAGSAALSAAESAGSAAWSAAGSAVSAAVSAAGSAAESAVSARSAERKWQDKILRKLIKAALKSRR